MRFLFGTRGKRSTIRKQPKRHEYGTLEDRRVLATVAAFNDASGVLSVSLTDSNEIAVISTDSGNVTINGSADLDTTTPGIQSRSVSVVEGITVSGNSSFTNQQVALAGNFNTGDLDNVSIELVSSISITGDYVLGGNLDLSLVNSGGGIGDGATGQLTVNGLTSIFSAQNPVSFNNGTHDFRGQFSVRTASTGTNNVVLTDINDLEFSAAEVWGSLTVDVGGEISDVSGATINVTADGILSADSIVLGDSVTDETNFFRVNLNTISRAEFQEDGNVIFFNDSEVGTLFVASETGGIFDTRTSSIEVIGNAEFQAERIRIGEHSADTFRAGSLTFQSTGHVDFFENDNTFLTGNSTARTLDITSLGNITDADDVTLTVEFTTGLVADNVYLGDTAADNVDLTTLYFFSEGDLFVNADSDIRIVEPKNFANALQLDATGAITDADDAAFEVATLARFIATEEITIGDTVDDEFNAGSVQFVSGQRTLIHEDSNLVLDNSAGARSVAPSADIISDGTITNEINADVDVSGNLSLLGNSINIGNRTGDEFNFGSLTVNTFNAAGTASVQEDSNTILTGNSAVRTLQLTSTGTILDADGSTTTVTGTTELAGSFINIGDVGSSFNSGALNVNSEGNVSVREDNGSIILTGINTANSLTLEANGNVLDTEFAETNINFLLDVTGDLINLGAESTDVLSFASLTFNSTGNTNIVENGNVLNGDAGFTLVGDSFSGDLLILETNGNILDDDNASTTVTERATFTGVDVVIGDTDFDCFEVLNETPGDLRVSVVASGVSSVTRGGC